MSHQGLVADLIKAWNDHDAKSVAEMHSADFTGVDVGEATPHQGRGGAWERTKRYLHAFPDLHIEAEETLFQGNQLAILWRVAGTHRGAFMNIPPTGRMITFRGVSLLWVKDRQIIRGVYMWDVAGLLREFRLLPDL